MLEVDSGHEPQTSRAHLSRQGISQRHVEDCARKFPRPYPGTYIPDLGAHPFFDPTASVEHNSELLTDHVLALGQNVANIHQHPYAAGNYSPSHPFPFNIHPKYRKFATWAHLIPGSVQPGPQDNCLTCTAYNRTCLDGPVVKGKCTLCQGKDALHAFKISKGEQPSGDAKKRNCYRAQPEYFINDYTVAHLFDPGNPEAAKGEGKGGRSTSKTTLFDGIGARKGRNKRRARNGYTSAGSGTAQNGPTVGSSNHQQGLTSHLNAAGLGQISGIQPSSGQSQPISAAALEAQDFASRVGVADRGIGAEAYGHLTGQSSDRKRKASADIEDNGGQPGSKNPRSKQFLPLVVTDPPATYSTSASFGRPPALGEVIEHPALFRSYTTYDDVVAGVLFFFFEHNAFQRPWLIFQQACLNLGYEFPDFSLTYATERSYRATVREVEIAIQATEDEHGSIAGIDRPLTFEERQAIVDDAAAGSENRRQLCIDLLLRLGFLLAESEGMQLDPSQVPDHVCLQLQHVCRIFD